MKITFSPRQAIGQADPMLFGHFLEHFHRQIYGGVYDPTSPFADADGFRQDVLDALRAIKTPIIRWPGGCYVSAYDWKRGVGKERIPTFDKAWRVEESNAFGTDEFVALCRKLNCIPYLCTNAGTGTPEQMSDWVEYCNLPNQGIYARRRMENGHPEPHNVKFWSIGNENWGGHEIGAKDSDEWGRMVRESAKMMLRVDPTLQLSAASIDDLDWNLNLLRTAGSYLDWISIHGYWDFSPDGLTYEDYNAVILHTGEDISGKIARVRAYLTALGLEKRIKISFDEWNLRGWYHPNIIDIWERDGKRREDAAFYRDEVIGPRDRNDINATYTMADAVFSAAFLNTCLRNCDLVGMACFSPVVNTRGAIFTHRDGIVLRPQYYVFALYANLLKQNVLNTWEADNTTISGTVRGEQRTVDAVDAVVTWDETGYAIAAINKHPGKETLLSLSMVDGHAAQMRLHILNGPTPDAYNDIGLTQVGVKTTEWQPMDANVTLPAHSVCVIELK